MCGICVTAGFEDERLLREMCSMMRHRDLDGGSTFLKAGVGFGYHQVRIRMEITYGLMCRWIL